MHQVESRTKDKALRDLGDAFDKYKRLNDLDRYFTKNLSDETREKVLENVKVL